MPEALSAQCGTHLDAAAVATCRRCGAFVCESCLALVGDDAYCPACAERRLAPASARARNAVWLPMFALLSLLSVGLFHTPLQLVSFLGAPLWLAGLVLNVGERRRLKGSAGSDALSTRRWLRAGAWLSVVAAAALLPWAVVAYEVLYHRHQH